MATLAQLMHIACNGSTGWKSRESWEKRAEEVGGKIRPERAVTVTAKRWVLGVRHNRVHQVPVLALRFQLIFPVFVQFFSFFLDDEREDGKTGGRWFKCQLTKGIRVENLQEKNSPHIIISHTRGHPKPNPSFAVPVPNE